MRYEARIMRNEAKRPNRGKPFWSKQNETSVPMTVAAAQCAGVVLVSAGLLYPASPWSWHWWPHPPSPASPAQPSQPSPAQPSPAQPSPTPPPSADPGQGTKPQQWNAMNCDWCCLVLWSGDGHRYLQYLIYFINPNFWFYMKAERPVDKTCYLFTMVYVAT